jgi:hypothetical protein
MLYAAINKSSEDFDDLFNHMENSDEESGEYPTPSELKMVKVEAFVGKEIYAGLKSNFADPFDRSN